MAACSFAVGAAFWEATVPDPLASSAGAWDVDVLLQALANVPKSKTAAIRPDNIGLFLWSFMTIILVLLILSNADQKRRQFSLLMEKLFCKSDGLCLVFI